MSSVKKDALDMAEYSTFQRGHRKRKGGMKRKTYPRDSLIPSLTWKDSSGQEVGHVPVGIHVPARRMYSPLSES